MAKKHRRYKKKKPMHPLLSVLLSLLVIAFVLAAPKISDYLGSEGYHDLKNSSDPMPEGEIEIHFVDVGQADAILIKTPDGNVVIDVGTNDASDALLDHYKEHGIETVKYMFFTHPHDDHMGAAETVIRAIEVENIIMTDRTSNAKFFTGALDAIEEKDINVIRSKIGDVYTVGGLKMTILAPTDEKYSDDDTNNSSIILLAEFGETSAIFTGDAESVSEKVLLSMFKASDLDCDLLKVGHHASSSSTTEEFLRALTPTYAVVSVGKNSYGHPDQAVLDRLASFGTTVYITQRDGSVIFTSDGKTLTKK